MLHGEIYEDGDKIASWSADLTREGRTDDMWHYKVNLTKTGQTFEATQVLVHGTDVFWVVYYLWNQLVNTLITARQQWKKDHDAPR